VECYIDLIKGALLSVQGEQTRSAHRVSTSQADGAPDSRIKFIAAHGARQEFSPLRRLNRHPPKNYVIFTLFIMNTSIETKYLK
jgi:hypothetical protein